MGTADNADGTEDAETTNLEPLTPSVTDALPAIRNTTSSPSAFSASSVLECLRFSGQGFQRRKAEPSPNTARNPVGGTTGSLR